MSLHVKCARLILTTLGTCANGPQQTLIIRMKMYSCSETTAERGPRLLSGGKHSMMLSIQLRFDSIVVQSGAVTWQLAMCLALSIF